MSTATNVSTIAPATIVRGGSWLYASLSPPSASSVASTATVLSQRAVSLASTQAMAGESLSCR